MPYYGYGYYSYTDFLANHLYFLLLKIGRASCRERV